VRILYKRDHVGKLAGAPKAHFAIIEFLQDAAVDAALAAHGTGTLVAGAAVIVMAAKGCMPPMPSLPRLGEGLGATSLREGSGKNGEQRQTAGNAGTRMEGGGAMVRVTQVPEGISSEALAAWLSPKNSTAKHLIVGDFVLLPGKRGYIVNASSSGAADAAGGGTPAAADANGKDAPAPTNCTSAGAKRQRAAGGETKVGWCDVTCRSRREAKQLVRKKDKQCIQLAGLHWRLRLHQNYRCCFVLFCFVFSAPPPLCPPPHRHRHPSNSPSPFSSSCRHG